MADENTPESQAPPTPEKVIANPPQMTEVSMIGNVFIEPGSVFTDQRRKARFVLGGLLVVILFSVFQITFVEKFGLEKIVRARFESSKRTQDMDADQKTKMIEQQSSDIAKYATYGFTPVVIILVFFIGGLIYWGGSKAMGGDGSYLGSVAVWVYASVPITIVFTIANLLVLFLKSPDDIDLANSQSGLVQANLGFFVDGKANPVLAALLGSIDFFAIWGWILAAIGLQKVAKISSGAAWAVVLIVTLIGVGFKVIGAMFF